MKDMTQIIEWLLKMETAAAILYDKAAAHFSSDREFAEFIRQLGREEQQHLEMMQRAAQVVKGMGEIAPAITIDRVVEESIEEGNFASCKKRLEERSLTKDEMMECVVATEFSEWNDIFLYVINVMKRGFREFIPAVARMQQHKKSIERFLETRPEFNAHLEKVRELADIWQEKILIVDDEEIIADVLSAILVDEGVIERAGTGEEGMKKLAEKYYAVIVSDVVMPDMNGIDFYKKAALIYPGINRRFLFFTATTGDEVTAFFTDNGIRFLPKPSRMSEIKKAVADILAR